MQGQEKKEVDNYMCSVKKKKKERKKNTQKNCVKIKCQNKIVNHKSQKNKKTPADENVTNKFYQSEVNLK